MIEHRSAGDDLLGWASEAESGTWSQLRNACAYLIASREMRRRPWQLARELSDLGHLDIDWEKGEWSISKPCLALSPGMGLCAFLAGWRPISLTERVRAAAADMEIEVFAVEQANSPHALYLKARRAEVLGDVAERLEIPLALDAPLQLADSILQESIRPGSLASAPPLDEDLQRFDTDCLSWLEVESRDQPGLYSFDLHGRRDFRLLRESEWHHVDRANGQLLELAGRADILGWHPQSGDHKNPRVLVIPLDVSLPVLAERAAVSASGLLPLVANGRRLYRNVSRKTATLLSERLGLELTAKPRAMKLAEETS